MTATNDQEAPPGAVAEFEAVAVTVAAYGAHDPRRFTYTVPDHLHGCLRPGQFVAVPFGERTTYGLVTAPVTERPDFGLRAVERLLHPAPLVSPTHLALAVWLADTYVTSAFGAVRLVLPPDLETWLKRALDPKPGASEQRRMLALASALPRLLLTPIADIPTKPNGRWSEAYRRWYGLLSNASGAVRWPHICAAVGETEARLFLRRWLDRDWITLAFEDIHTMASLSPRVERRPGGEESPPCPAATQDDGHAVSVLHATLPQTRFDHYRTLIRSCVEAGRQALLLVPDRQQIAPALDRLQLDDLRVATWHAEQGQRERLEHWARAQAGTLDLVAGVRSALFAPLSRLGLIIVEQEHDDAYKNDATPRYRAATVAVELGRLTGARVVLGSATPDAATYLQGRRGVWTLDQPPERDTPRSVEIVDLRRERTVGRQELVSRPLHRALGATLSSGERAILLLTRRGAAHSLRCRDCAYVLRCPRCATPAAVHGQRDGAGRRSHLAPSSASGVSPAGLLCHYCGSALHVPALCPQCGGTRLRAQGPGTQGLETELRRLFPRTTVFRWDADTVWPPGGPAQVLAAFARGDIAVLVGTQRLLRMPNRVAAPLVGVVDADTGLHLPDFRAAEHVFRSLLGAAALAEGTNTRPARVLIQTREPQHYCFRAFLLPRRAPSGLGAALDPTDLRAAYARFMAADGVDRRELGYPPYGTLWRLLFLHRLDSTAEREASRCAITLRNAVAAQSAPTDAEVEVIGPAPAYIRRLRDRARWHVLLRGPPHRLAALVSHVPRGWTIDTDPTTLL
ncbi:MAG: primosomal protein N' [Chloroflexota bacterium]|nr:primosomal protein N' [Chloroflexota bacterium]